ncbi:SGNH/GDSL hydrolase family protein [Sphingomonas sp. BT-65]|uniref:SGNH/GDSL hydrolase family protein n=1 Tax=Sphingomonas sp. BT-65 TaxID=2989821 RepID=UPI0022355536|nr:SGNH/GDSL hydrolase family protein [Sphingomonas sp. BT-65]MCW4462041.1 SGNH/GDSL hydrolase family protein [Sphingomonas sp. BT-65]
MLGCIALVSAVPAAAQACPWRAAWASSQTRPDSANALPAEALADTTLRQIVRSSIAGNQVRVRISNVFGDAPLRIAAATIARSAGNGSARIHPQTLRTLRFADAPGAVVPPGSDWLSDPVTLPIGAFDDLVVSIRVMDARGAQTAHPGSRATSYHVQGDMTAATDLPAAARIDRWHMLSGIEVTSCTARGGIVVLGDSITDGRGSTTNGNDRWTDFLARRLGGRLAVINQGIGGNRVLLDGLGPSAMARLDRDVLAQPGVAHLILLEGVNDLGTLGRDKPATDAQYRALVTQLTGAYAQIVARARARGLRVHGATILPFMGNDYYRPTEAAERARQAINQWIRTRGNFDSVIDFDHALRDPARPAYLAPQFDTGDGLHPNPAGFRAMANAVSLTIFK